MIFISVDPGTSTCGVVIWNIKFKNKKIIINKIDSFTITINRDIYVEVRIKKIYDIMVNIININQPTFLVHESGFLDRFRPMAFGPIYATILNIRQAFRDVYNTKNDDYLFMYSPKLVKSKVSTGEADKFDMFKAVTSINELKPFITGAESEHVIDALAIGYTHILNIRERPEILFL